MAILDLINAFKQPNYLNYYLSSDVSPRYQSTHTHTHTDTDTHTHTHNAENAETIKTQGI